MPAQPPSREPAPEEVPNDPLVKLLNLLHDGDDIVQELLADRARDQARIVALENLAQDVADSGYGDAIMGLRDKASAVLKEVPDARA